MKTQRDNLPVPVRLHMEAGQPLEYVEACLKATDGNADSTLQLLKALPKFDPVKGIDPVVIATISRHSEAE
jgi:hypothetical protein